MAYYYFHHAKLYVVSTKNSPKTRHVNIQKAAWRMYRTNYAFEEVER